MKKKKPDFIHFSITGFSVYVDDRTLWTEKHVSSQEMSHTVAFSLIDLEVLKFDHFSRVVKNLFSQTPS